MQEPRPLDHGEKELEKALGGLRLAPFAPDVEQLWYRAGLAAGRRRARIWQAVAAAVALAAAGAVTWRPKPTPVFVDRVVTVRQDVPTEPVRALTAAEDAPAPIVSADYLRLRDAVVQKGLDAVPPMAIGAGEAASPVRAWPPTELLDPQPPFSSRG